MSKYLIHAKFYMSQYLIHAYGVKFLSINIQQRFTFPSYCLAQGADHPPNGEKSEKDGF